MKRSIAISSLGVVLLFAAAVGAQTVSAAKGCSDASDLRVWRTTVLSNYQSSKPEEKKLAIESAKKFIEKANRCQVKDEFLQWVAERLPGWEAGGRTVQDVSPYDPELAKKLGADERGMKMYVMCILKTGPKDALITGKEREDIFAGHFANIRNLAGQGKLAIAGPFEKNDRSYRGLYIFNVPTIEEAEKLVVLDPAVKAGIFVPELTLWYGSASLMATPEIHKRLEKPKPN
jgi:uncharacterized protein YciI